MKSSSMTAILSAAALLGSASLARAQEHVVQKTETVTESGGPSRPMMVSGLVTFGLVYVPSVVVAATSDRSADQRLFIPFAGPWLALPDRGGCGGTTGHGCTAETTYKVLLVADGIVQALGAVLFIRSFFTPEVRTTSTTTRASSPSPSIRVAPTVTGSAFGLAAVGAF